MSEIPLLLRRCKRGNEIKLDLSEKFISVLPSDIYLLTQLEVLDLSSNKLNSLDQKISQLQSLKVLNLSNNNIISLPNSLLTMKNLQMLNLQGNPLSSQFERLLKDENQIGSLLRSSLSACFNEEAQEKAPLNKTNFGWSDHSFGSNFKSENNGSTSSLSWMDSNPILPPPSQQQSQQSSQGNIMGQLAEKDNQLSQQKKQIQDLELQLQKLSLSSAGKGNNSQNKGLIKVQPILEPIPELQMKDIEIRELISQGVSAVVNKGTYRGCNVSIKKISNSNLSSDQQEEINNEINVLSRLRHPNIILIMGIVSQPQNICIVSELIEGGDLNSYLHSQRKDLNGSQKSFIGKQLINALYYLHSMQIVHRNINSSNVLLDVGFKIKLSNFGQARKFSDLNQGNSKVNGPPSYSAPELLQKKSYDEKVDVFAFGTLLWEIYSQEIPFDGLEQQEINTKIMNDEQLPQRQCINANIYKLILKCRHSNPSFRPSLEKLYQEFNQIT